MQRLRRYGLNEEQFEAMLKEQGGKCKICRRTSGSSKSLNVDHCHRTGDIRGLLCEDCNRAIGLFREDAMALVRAIQYVGNNGRIHCA